MTDESNWRRELVMQLVDMLVQRTPMQCPVKPIMVHVLKDEEEGDLGEHEGDRRERDLVGGHAEVATDRVEGEDQGEFDGEVGDEDDFDALPDLCGSDVLVLRA